MLLVNFQDQWSHVHLQHNQAKTLVMSGITFGRLCQSLRFTLFFRVLRSLFKASMKNQDNCQAMDRTINIEWNKCPVALYLLFLKSYDGVSEMRVRRG